MTAAVCVVVGVALGLASLATLARTAELIVAGRVIAAVALQVARLALVALAFTLLARRGWSPLAAGFAGFVVARTWRLRRQR